MRPDPKAFPISEKGRDQLADLITQLRQTDDKRALGIALATMAQMVKHTGTSDGSPAFETAAKFGREAVGILREVGDKAELARALRMSALPFEPIDHEALLLESVQLAREAGDRVQEGWTLYRMTRSQGVPGTTTEEALAVFEEACCLEGQATCLLSLGFSRNPREPKLIEQAVKIYEEVGDERQARIARMYLKAASDSSTE